MEVLFELVANVFASVSGKAAVVLGIVLVGLLLYMFLS